MISIVYIKKNTHTYRIHKDYLLKRNMYFQKQLEDFGIESSGFLIEVQDGFQYTGNMILKKNTEVLLITDATLSVKEFHQVKKFLNLDKIEVLGCVVTRSQLGNKTILHPCLDNPENIPNWYKERQTDFSDFTIPGYTCFSLESVTKSFRSLKTKYPKETLRLKFGNGTSGIDHYLIKTEKDLADILILLNNFSKLSEVGAAIELNLIQIESYGVTKLKILDTELTTIGKQSTQNSVYIGSELVTVNTSKEKELIKICNKVLKKIEPYAEQLNRFNVDIVIGKLASGEIIKGITDISLKIGAATIIELNKLIANTDTGVYQIYSTQPIKTRNQKLLIDFLKDNNLSLTVVSRYILTISYPIKNKKILTSTKFKNLENKIKKIDYNKNILFSPE